MIARSCNQICRNLFFFPAGSSLHMTTLERNTGSCHVPSAPSRNSYTIIPQLSDLLRGALKVGTFLVRKRILSVSSLALSVHLSRDARDNLHRLVLSGTITSLDVCFFSFPGELAMSLRDTNECLWKRDPAACPSRTLFKEGLRDSCKAPPVRHQATLRPEREAQRSFQKP